MKHRWSLTFYVGLWSFIIGRSGVRAWSRHAMGSTQWTWAIVFWYNGRMFKAGSRLNRAS